MKFCDFFAFRIIIGSMRFDGHDSWLLRSPEQTISFIFFFAMRLKEAFGNLIFDLDKSTKKQMKWKRKQKHSKMRTHKFSKPKLIGSFRVNFLTHADDLYSLSNAVTAAQHKKEMNFNYDLLRKQNALIPLKLGENQRVWFGCEVV